jgi:mannosyltransferase OCH1-like enzyme
MRKIIHQIWIGEEDYFPKKYHGAMESWVQANPEFEFMYWTRSKCEQFLQAVDSQAYEKYSKLQKNIQKADFIRFFILFYYGGLYTDLDAVCRKNIGDIYNLTKSYQVVLYSHVYCVDIDFMISQPGSELFATVTSKLRQMTSANLDYNYVIASYVLPILNRNLDLTKIRVLKEDIIFNCQHCYRETCEGDRYVTRFNDKSFASTWEKAGLKMLCSIGYFFGKYGVIAAKKMSNFEDYYHK